MIETHDRQEDDISCLRGRLLSRFGSYDPVIRSQQSVAWMSIAAHLLFAVTCVCMMRAGFVISVGHPALLRIGSAILALSFVVPALWMQFRIRRDQMLAQLYVTNWTSAVTPYYFEGKLLAFVFMQIAGHLLVADYLLNGTTPVLITILTSIMVIRIPNMYGLVVGVIAYARYFDKWV